MRGSKVVWLGWGGGIGRKGRQLQLNNNKNLKKCRKNLNRHFTKEDIQMIQRDMKRSSASLAIREMQMKTIVKYLFIPVRIAIINISTNNKCWRGCLVKGSLVHCFWEYRLLQPLWETVGNFLRKLKMELPFEPAIALLGLYPRNPETPIHKNLCTPRFIGALFAVATCWKQSKCPSGNEWIKNTVHLYNGVLCSREKEGAPTLCESMGGNDEHYAK